MTNPVIRKGIIEEFHDMLVFLNLKIKKCKEYSTNMLKCDD